MFRVKSMELYTSLLAVLKKIFIGETNILVVNSRENKYTFSTLTHSIV